MILHLIHLSDVESVFYTDEVETHLSSGLQLDIQKREYVSITRSFGLRQINPIIDFGSRDKLGVRQSVLNQTPDECFIIGTIEHSYSKEFVD